jgi:hypothetical protein
VADRAASPARAFADDDGPSAARVTCVSTPPRELAQRLSGTVEVLLLWYPETDQVEVSVRDLGTGVGFEIEVAPGNAIDAFDHPYAYAARPDSWDLSRAQA